MVTEHWQIFSACKQGCHAEKVLSTGKINRPALTVQHIIDYRLVLSLHEVIARMKSVDNRAVFIFVLFSVMIHYFAYCRSSQSGAWGPPELAGGAPQENTNCKVIMRECIKSSVFTQGCLPYFLLYILNHNVLPKLSKAESSCAQSLQIGVRCLFVAGAYM